jgi:hypothetical protein
MSSNVIDWNQDYQIYCFYVWSLQSYKNEHNDATNKKMQYISKSRKSFDDIVKSNNHNINFIFIADSIRLSIKN